MQGIEGLKIQQSSQSTHHIAELNASWKIIHQTDPLNNRSTIAMVNKPLSNRLQQKLEEFCLLGPVAIKTYVRCSHRQLNGNGASLEIS